MRQYGDKKWDVFLRLTAGAALVGIPFAIWVPESIPLVWLAVVGVPSNSPLGPIIPTGFEPFIMIAAKYYDAFWVTVVATAIYMYMEYVNWHVYGWVLRWDKLEPLKDKRWVKWGMENFAKSPFWITMFFAVTPVPFWIARCLALLNKYPIWPFMLATAIGRFPRLFLYAWLGDLLRIPTPLLVGVAVGTAVILIGYKLVRGQRILENTILDTGN